MSQDVNIQSIGNLPTWATEETLKKVASLLADSTNTSNASLRQLVSTIVSGDKDAAKAMNDLAKTLKPKGGAEDPTGGGTTREGSGRLHAAMSQPHDRQLSESSDALKGMQDDLGDAMGSLTRRIESGANHLGVLGDMSMGIADSFRKMGKETDSMMGKLVASGGGGILGMITGAVGAFYNIMMDAAGGMKNMYEAGIRGVDTSLELNRHLGELAMTTDQYADLMVRNSSLMRIYGEDVLVNMVGRSQDLTKSMASFGLTTAEAAEFAAEELEQRRVSGLFRRLSEAEQRTVMAESLTQLTEFSEMLGVSRKEIQKQQTDMLKDRRIQSVLAGNVGERAREGVEQVVGAFSAIPGGEEFNNMFAQMFAAADPSQALSEFGLTMATAPEGVHEMMELVRRIKSGELKDQEEIAVAQARVLEGFHKNADAMSQMSQYTLDPALQSFTGSVMSIGALAEQQGGILGALMRAQDGQTEQVSQATESAATFQDTMTSLRKDFDRAVTEVVGALGGGPDDALAGSLNLLTGLAKNLSGVIGAVSESMSGGLGNFRTWVLGFLDDVKEKGFISTIVKRIGAKMKEWGENFMSWGIKRLEEILNAALDRIPFVRKNDEERRETVRRTEEHNFDTLGVGNDGAGWSTGTSAKPTEEEPNLSSSRSFGVLSPIARREIDMELAAAARGEDKDYSGAKEATENQIARLENQENRSQMQEQTLAALYMLLEELKRISSNTRATPQH